MANHIGMLADGTQLRRYDVLNSTNAEVLALARSGARGPTWVLSERQTAGRGRHGRQWSSPAGNLYATLLLDDPCSPMHAAQLSFVAALALYDALTGLAVGLRERLQLKWPNDMLLDGAKLAGILIEGESRAGGGTVAAIGFGVNCVSCPQGTPYPATDLSAAGFKLSPSEVLDRLSSSMQQRLAEWDRGRNFGSIRNAWLLRAAGLHRPVILRSSQEAAGAFEGIDEHGRLLLRQTDGALQVFSTGDVDWMPSARESMTA